MIVLFLWVPAFADPAPTILHLDQSAERQVPRDRLTVELRAEATGTDPAHVQAEVNRLMAKALAQVKTVPAVKAASGGYRTYRTVPTGPDGKPEPPAQWHVAQDLTLGGGDFKAALDLAGRLQADGLVIGDMRFDIAPATLRAQQRALTDEALNQIMARAGGIAATLGLKIRNIENLRVGNATEPGGGARPLMMARAVAAAAPPPAAEAGDATVSVSVEADIALIQK